MGAYSTDDCCRISSRKPCRWLSSSQALKGWRLRNPYQGFFNLAYADQSPGPRVLEFNCGGGSGGAGDWRGLTLTWLKSERCGADALTRQSCTGSVEPPLRLIDSAVSGKFETGKKIDPNHCGTKLRCEDLARRDKARGSRVTAGGRGLALPPQMGR